MEPGTAQEIEAKTELVRKKSLCSPVLSNSGVEHLFFPPPSLESRVGTSWRPWGVLVPPSLPTTSWAASGHLEPQFLHMSRGYKNTIVL